MFKNTKAEAPSSRPTYAHLIDAKRSYASYPHFPQHTSVQKLHNAGAAYIVQCFMVCGLEKMVCARMYLPLGGMRIGATSRRLALAQLSGSWK